MNYGRIHFEGAPNAAQFFNHAGFKDFYIV